MASGRPTMKDVAARAGVGIKTVSRVVNGGLGRRAQSLAPLPVRSAAFGSEASSPRGRCAIRTHARCAEARFDS